MKAWERLVADAVMRGQWTGENKRRGKRAGGGREAGKFADIEALKRALLENEAVPKIDVKLNEVVATSLEIADIWCVLDYLKRNGVVAPRLYQLYEKIAHKQYKQFAGSNAMSTEEVRRRGIAIGIVRILDGIDAGDDKAREFAADQVQCTREELRKWLNASKSEIVPEGRQFCLSPGFVANHLGVTWTRLIGAAPNGKQYYMYLRTPDRPV